MSLINNKKIILILLIKNEFENLKKCIDFNIKFCDAIAITDIGSDEIILNNVKTYINNLEFKNIKVYENDWINCEYNRNNSFLNAISYCNELKWEQKDTYGLFIDTNMAVAVNNFNKEQLTDLKYKICYSEHEIESSNLHLVRLDFSHNYYCIGYETFELLPKISKHYIYIHNSEDINNEILIKNTEILINETSENPNVGENYFYLGQNYKKHNKIKEAIINFKKCIKICKINFFVWYSHYLIALCYENLNKINKLELWANKTYNLNNKRPEPIHLLTKVFREKGLNFKSYHYYKIGKNIINDKKTILAVDILEIVDNVKIISNDNCIFNEQNKQLEELFIERNVYTFLFDYNYCIIHYWIFTNERIDGLKQIINYVNKYTFNESNMNDNIEFYIQRLGNNGNITKLDVPIINNYICSSPAIIKYNNKIIVNLRYVNYRIQPDGSYMMYEGDSFLHHNDVKTLNGLIYMDNKYNILTNVSIFNEKLENTPTFATHIKGLEDIRLFEFKNKIHYIATTREYSYCNTNRIIMGEYDITTMKFKNNVCLYPPHETYCEKNWIPLPTNNDTLLFIYEWHPLQIGKLDKNNKLEIIIKNNMPSFFKHYRGSTNFCEYEGQLWCITHGVKYTTPRKYYHQFVVLDKNTYKLIKYSIPFYFNNFSIEYTVGLLIDDTHVVILFSQNDKDASLLKIKINKIHKYFI